jgi:hypothetical protein
MLHLFQDAGSGVSRPANAVTPMKSPQSQDKRIESSTACLPLSQQGKRLLREPRKGLKRKYRKELERKARFPLEIVAQATTHAPEMCPKEKNANP